MEEGGGVGWGVGAVILFRPASQAYLATTFKSRRQIRSLSMGTKRLLLKKRAKKKEEKVRVRDFGAGREKVYMPLRP